MQFRLQVQQFIALALHHLIDRNTRPACYYFGDIVLINLFLNEALGIEGVQRLLRGLDISFRGRNLAVTHFRYLAVIAFALRYFRLMFQGLDTRFFVLNSRYISLLLVPAGI